MTIFNNDYTTFIKYCNNEIEEYESKNIVNLKRMAFYCNNFLKRLSFPKVTNVREYAFGFCSNLEYVNLPSVTTFGQAVFSYTQKLKTISLPSVTALNSHLFISSKIEQVFAPNVLTIQHNCFEDCPNLFQLDCFDKVRNIQNNSFSGCISLTELPLKSLVTLNHSAFKNCTGLTKIWIPTECVTIEAENATNAPFYGCNSNCVIYTNATAPKTNWSDYWNYYDDTHKLEVCWDATFEDYENDNYRNKSTLENIVDGSIRDIVYDGPMTALEAFGMAGISFLHSISLKEITMIPMHYFEKCSGLKKITSESFPKLTFIRNGGFTSCEGLTEVDIPSVLQIEDAAFQGCNSLRKMWIPSTCTKLGKQLFAYATNLTVYTDASEKLNDWDENWNSMDWDNTSFATVKYNSTHDEYLAA